jgi:hypothetical protein
VKIVIKLTPRQIADIRRQLAGAKLASSAKRAAKPKQRYTSSDARRAYMRELMRQRRAAAKAETASTISTAH